MMDNTWYYNTDSFNRHTLYCKRKLSREGEWVTLVFFYKVGFNMDSIYVTDGEFKKMLNPNHLPTSLQMEFIKYFFKFNDGINPEW